ncbi:transglutaminase family protein cysteine peptidase BTLCP [Sphingobium chlorophenolicum L-1]|uniref:Transglutaminase family protein cysteine peptidase BTLCP n=1 Tax=Sphingobium chlorophenolicum L-1 TaxID=690566 RepID=F6EWE8_SPHCR|nr:transglutaminase-like cysteine peptidase [Sphingobium chlorophenolicum]AEG48081.1 transglutaminase family protein cysteine peptidase BTLCP [Sphingobium chlorophenolicum L-1]
MSGFVPSSRPALCRIALRAAPALLLVTAGSHALAQAPLGAFPDTFGQGRVAYTPADRVSANLLAGGMSRLAAISAQQGGAVDPAPWIAQPVAPDAIVNDRRINDFSGKLPGWRLQGVQLSVVSYRQPELVPGFMRGFLSPPTAAALPQASAFVMPARPVPALSGQVMPPRSGQPDVFGSVAMPISRTLLDGKWASVSAGLPGKGVWSGVLNTARGSAAQQQVEMINSWVNGRLRFVDDRQGGDNWASAARTLQNGGGDCEDYAIAKMKLLEAAGFDRHAMFLVIARDLVRQADHAVLAVRIGGELVILDNMTDRVLPSSSVSDYRPIMSFNAFGRWTHGYRVTTPAKVQFAAR